MVDPSLTYLNPVSFALDFYHVSVLFANTQSLALANTTYFV